MFISQRVGHLGLSFRYETTPPRQVVDKTQISGKLTEVGFKEGQSVKKGDFLAQIDPRPYQAALDQAKGQLARDEALLAAAKIDLGRYEKLMTQELNCAPAGRYPARARAAG